VQTSCSGSTTDLRALDAFYAALADLERRLGGRLRLETCTRRDVARPRGVYFFFEEGEARTGSGAGDRVVRVGTHGPAAETRSTLWGRLRQHRGTTAGTGNQRGSIFRRHVGAALMDAGRVAQVDGWWTGSSATPEQREAEREAERAVSRIIGRMPPFLWLPVDDDAGPGSGRAYVERNAIALLSGRTARAAYPPSAGWLGRHARAAEIRESGLWNVRHVGEAVDPGFVDRLHRMVRDFA
jgi:hypothetical protein